MAELQQFKEGNTYFGYNPDTQQGAAFSTPEAFKAAGFSDFDPNAQAPTFDTAPLLQAPDRFVNVQLNPSTTTNTDTLSQPPVTTQDIQSLIKQNQEFQNKVLGYFTPTAEETKAQQELDNLDTSFRQGMNQIEDKVIPMEFITGQQASVERRYQTSRATAVQNLTRLQQNRQALLQAATTQAGFNQNNIAQQLQLRQIEQSEQAAAIKFAIENNVQTPFFKVGETVYPTSGGKPFTSEADFLARTGMSVEQAGVQGLITTPQPEKFSKENVFGSDALGYFHLDPRTGKKTEILPGLGRADQIITDPLTGNQFVWDSTNNKLINPFGDGPIPGADTGIPAETGLLQQQFNAVSRKITKDQYQRAYRDFNAAIQSGDLVGAQNIIDSLAYQNLEAKQKNDYTAYDAAEDMATNILGSWSNYETVNAGPWKSLLEKNKTWAGLAKDKTFTQLYKDVETAQAEIRRGLFGTALTGTELKSAERFLITDSDDLPTVKMKIQGLLSLSRKAKRRLLDQEKGDLGPSPQSLEMMEDAWSNQSRGTFTPKATVEMLPKIEPIGPLASRNPSKYGVIGEFDITSYATDPNHERAVAKFYEQIPPMTTREPVWVDRYVQSIAKGSPVKGQDVLDAAKKYNVDANLMLALMRQDSLFGTKGKAVRTKNPGNVGNTDSGATQGFTSWRDGVFAVAKNLSKRRVKVIA